MERSTSRPVQRARAKRRAVAAHCAVAAFGLRHSGRPQGRRHRHRRAQQRAASGHSRRRRPCPNLTRRTARPAAPVIDPPDINVWLALVNKCHAQHQAASRYWETQASETLSFCRVTALGFFALEHPRPRVRQSRKPAGSMYHLPAVSRYSDSAFSGGTCWPRRSLPRSDLHARFPASFVDGRLSDSLLPCGQLPTRLVRWRFPALPRAEFLPPHVAAKPVTLLRHANFVRRRYPPTAQTPPPSTPRSRPYMSGNTNPSSHQRHRALESRHPAD